MASTRLNQEHRRRIREKLIGNQFKEQRDELDRQASELALEVYVDALGEDHEPIRQAPSYWFHHDDDISVVFGGDYTHLDFPQDENGKARRLPFPAGNRCGANAKYEASHPFSERYAEIKRRRGEIDDEERKLRTQIDAVLNSSHTAKALVNKWPEIRLTVDSVVNEYTSNLPAPQLEELNQKLGLNEPQTEAAQNAGD